MTSHPPVGPNRRAAVLALIVELALGGLFLATGLALLYAGILKATEVIQ